MKSFSANQKLALASLLLAAAAVLLYWPALRLPLLYDDLLHIRLTSEVDWLTVWIPTDSFAFYRPLVFVPFLLIEELFGFYPAPLLHGLNVAQHAADVVLLVTLIWRLWRRWTWALVAGLLLTVFPFAYQAVVMYANNAYPASAGWMLLGLHTYLSGLRSGRRHWWALSLIIFLAFLLTHETAVLFGPLAALLQWNAEGRLLAGPDEGPAGSRPRINWAWMKHRPWLFFTLAGAAYILLYQFLPRGAPPQTDFGTNDPVIKLLYFLQIATYPLSGFAHRLPGVAAHWIILAATAITLAWTAWAARPPGNRLPLLFGWGWWGLASLLLGLPLPTYYLTHGARLLYLGAVGLVFVWAVLLISLARLPKVGVPLTALAVTFILVSNVAFVTDRLAAYTDITEPVTQVTDVMFDQPAAEGVLLINLPQWTAPPRNHYPIGAEFVTMMGGHLFAEELVVENLRQNRPVLALKVNELLSDPGYGYGVHQQASLPTIEAGWAAAGSHIFVTDYSPAGVEASYVGAFQPAAESPDFLAELGPYRLLAAEAGRCDGQVSVELRWAAAAPAETPAPSTSVFVQLLGKEGALVTQSDGPPLRLRPDFVQLPAGWQIHDRRILAAETGAEVLVGVYDYVTGERAAAVDEAGAPLPDNAWRIPVEACGS